MIQTNEVYTPSQKLITSNLNPPPSIDHHLTTLFVKLLKSFFLFSLPFVPTADKVMDRKGGYVTYATAHCSLKFNML